MAGFHVDRKLALGLLWGMGLGFASAALLCPRWRSRIGSVLRDGTLAFADHLTAPVEPGRERRNRRTERAGRALSRSIERMRSAGF